MEANILEQGDRATGQELTLQFEVPGDDYNRQVRIVACDDGIQIDRHITIPWEWVNKAFRAISNNGKTAQASSQVRSYAP
jgi:hypothetical protein